MIQFKSFQEYELWLGQKGFFHMDLNLGRVNEALEALGLKEPPYPIIQTLGTNGKGSTCAFLASLAKAHGLKTGLYSSPHFVSIKERILVNGAEVEDCHWLECLNTLQKLPVSEELTYFEHLTVLGALLFAHMGVDVAIFEAGLGGRNDATTALPALIHCFTSIGMDHASVIGPGLVDIARDKALAIKSGSKVISASQFPGAAVELINQAQKKDVSVKFAKPLISGNRRLAGKFQSINAGLALSAWRCLAGILKIESAREEHGLEQAFLPGRMQRIEWEGTKLILDGGHNPHAIAALLPSMQPRPEYIIFSALADKNWRDCLGQLLRLDVPVLIPQMSNSRAANASEMAKWANNVRDGSAKPFDDTTCALEFCRQSAGYVLVCGSLYLLSEFFTLYPKYLKKDQR